MKEKKNSETTWIIFSVLSVIAPVIIAFILSSIINGKVIDLSNIIESIILVVFSIACSLLSICWNVNKQKSDKFTYFCFWISGFAMVLSWTTYIVSLTHEIIHLKTICFISLIVVIICSFLGIKLGKKNDENENETIHTMHENCILISKKLVDEDCYKDLAPHMVNNYDLLCNPDQFNRIEEVLKNIEGKVNRNEVQKQ